MARLRRGFALAFCVALGLAPGVASAQRLNPNERAAPQQPNVEDKDDLQKHDSKIWVLDFRFTIRAPSPWTSPAAAARFAGT